MPIMRKITALDANPDPDGRPPEAFVRFRRRRDRHHKQRLELTIGRELWYRLGKPERVVVEQRRHRLLIAPSKDIGGKKLHVTNSSPRTWAPASLNVEPGRYAAKIRYGVIVVGEREPEENEQQDASAQTKPQDS